MCIKSQIECCNTGVPKGNMLSDEKKKKPTKNPNNSSSNNNTTKPKQTNQLKKKQQTHTTQNKKKPKQQTKELCYELGWSEVILFHNLMPIRNLVISA